MAQDTMTYMHYNLLNYGVSTSYCTPQNNDMSVKEGYIKEIFSFKAPDILTVNEINPYWAYHKRFNDSTLLLLFPNKYAYKAGTNFSGNNLGNGLFYRKDKMMLYRHQSVSTAVRDFDVFTMYYQDAQLPTSGDTAFLTIISGHFKAGSTATDEADRLAMAQTLISFLDTFEMKGPILLAGDFNMKSSSESAFQTLLSGPDPSRRFQDPLNANGTWYSNSSFAAIHTQSTQTSTLGCASGGGLDDRFDIILSSPILISGSGHYQIVPNSYVPLGNDGQHFNQDINAGANTAVPSNVANALHEASDHLPVTLRLRVDQQGVSIDEDPSQIGMVTMRVEGDILNVDFHRESKGIVQLFDIQGKLILIEHFEAGSQNVAMNISRCQSGIYICVVSCSTHCLFTRKVFIDK